jgi:hypothetical protein
MALRLITATERLSDLQNKDTLLIVGENGVGKTSLLYTIPPEIRVLALDMEAGLKSVQEWNGDSIPIRTWEELAEIACLIIGPDPTAQPTDFLSEGHCASVIARYGPIIDLKPYRLLFVDSITEMSRLCAAWCKGRPDSWTTKVLKDGTAEITPNNFGFFGLIAREMIRFLKHFQRAPGLDVVFVGILERVEDEFHRPIWQLQLEGGKTGRELPGIVNNVLTMDRFEIDQQGSWIHAPGNGSRRMFVCSQPNPFSLPAKDRSGTLDVLERAHLGELLAKINRPARAASERLVYGPAQQIQT